jgi:hypothetical protein
MLKRCGWAIPKQAIRRVPTTNPLTNRHDWTELHQLNSRVEASKRADPLDSLRLARLNGVQQDRLTRHNERYHLKNVGIRPRTHSPVFDVSTTAPRDDRRVGGSGLHFLTHLLDSVHYPARWERDHVHYRGGGRIPFCSGMHFHSVLFRTLGPVSKLEADRQMIPLSHCADTAMISITGGRKWLDGIRTSQIAKTKSPARKATVHLRPSYQSRPPIDPDRSRPRACRLHEGTGDDDHKADYKQGREACCEQLRSARRHARCYGSRVRGAVEGGVDDGSVGREGWRASRAWMRSASEWSWASFSASRRSKIRFWSFMASTSTGMMPS